MSHLLICCTIPKELMNLLLCQFGASWVMPNSIIAMLASWMGNLANSIVQRFGWWLLNVIYGACGERKRERERNNHTFKGKELLVAPMLLKAHLNVLKAQNPKVFALYLAKAKLISEVRL